MISGTAPAMGLAALFACALLAALLAAPPAVADPAPDPAPDLAPDLARWVTVTGDNEGLPFLVVDKPAARVFAYDAYGGLVGAAPALLGLAQGDGSTPGVGDRELSDIPPEDRTTPAGRFQAAYGPAAQGGRVLWVDYATAVSLHPLAEVDPGERRRQRLASATPDDNRITYGCINVPPAFYGRVVEALFEDAGGIVYVLPDTRPLAETFPAFAAR